MAARRDRTKEVRELARVLYRLVREREISSPDRVKVSSSLSRILGHVPEWRALRQRKDGTKTRRLSKEPSFLSVVDAAKELNVPICVLAPTIDHQPLTVPQRKFLVLAARWMIANFTERDDERAAYVSDFEDFEPYVTFEKLEYESAAGRTGRGEQLVPEAVDVLASIPGIGNERLQVTTVRGDSMADRLRPGDRILVDIYRRTPRNGEMIVVDLGHLGRAIGYWRREGKRSFLDKENEATIDLGSPNDFSILGTVIALVWSPIGSRAR